MIAKRLWKKCSKLFSKCSKLVQNFLKPKSFEHFMHNWFLKCSKLVQNFFGLNASIFDFARLFLLDLNYYIQYYFRLQNPKTLADLGKKYNYLFSFSKMFKTCSKVLRKMFKTFAKRGLLGCVKVVN